MKLIPAIDLKNNKVVIASKGKEREYEEISSILSPTSDPCKFINYLLSLYDFNTIYLADLDSISNFNNKNIFLQNIIQTFSNLDFIIDNGVRKYSHLYSLNNSNYIQIIGTETFKDYEILNYKKDKKYILSLDFKDGIIIAQNNNYRKICPKKVISMNLDNVGEKTGINYNNIRLINNIYPDAEIIISGGIANTEDILEAKVNNCSEIILLTAILEKNIIYSKL